MAKHYQAVVGKVVSNGKHGPYAVAHHEELGSVTFALTPEVWKNKKWPEAGSEVLLSNITRKRAGWRAGSARFLKPTDLKPARED